MGTTQPLLTDELRALLGTMPDPDLAKFAGVRSETIRKWRLKYDVAPYCPKYSHPGKGNRTGGARIRPPTPVRSIEEIMGATPPELRSRARDEFSDPG